MINAAAETPSVTIEGIENGQTIEYGTEVAAIVSAASSYNKITLFLNGEEAASAAAKRMVELCLIDDEGFADRYAEIMLNVKGWSPSRAIRELVLKGIDRDYAEQAVASVGVSP